ncbi:MAG: hypothetical protein ACI841_002375 [Planctomycetota bacterium]
MGGSFQCTGDVNELVCKDNYFFGMTSQVFLKFSVGVTYKIRMTGKDSGGLFNFNMRYLPANDACVDAEPVVGTAYFSPFYSTHHASIEPCEALEDCELNNIGVSNSVWYSFIPPCDGAISVNTNGSSYDTVLSIHNGCAEFIGIEIPCALPAQLARDDDSGTGLTS